MTLHTPDTRQQAVVERANDLARVAASFSPRAVQIARIIHVEHLLLELRPPTAHPVRPVARLELRQQLLERIVLATVDVQSVLAEIDCEQARGEQLRRGLEGIAANRSQRFALVGILIGATTVLTAGAVALARPERDAAEIIGILGGSSEAGIGIAGLSEGGGRMFRTERNMLRDLWDGREQSELFPPTVWRFLNQATSSAVPGLSVRAELLARWRRDERLDDTESRESQRRIALLFGNGGPYTPADLQLREALLDLLQARVWLMSQDLDLLLRELVTLLDAYKQKP